MPAAGLDADPFELSLEELMDMEVLSVSKRSQSRFTAAAAVHVITWEDIQRSGATSLGEALRGVPGLQVARTSDNAWAISGRGFNGSYANKLLVLVDGRTIYNPSFSGVRWDHQDFFMADIDRIEIIRGPGAAMWGANAVNGVINILTKHSRDSQGGEVSSVVGNGKQILNARYGAEAGDGPYRVYAKWAERDSLDPMNFPGLEATARTLQVGVRTDQALSDRDTLMISAEYLNLDSSYVDSVINPLTNLPVGRRREDDADFAAAVVRWQHEGSNGSSHEIQADFQDIDQSFYYRMLELKYQNSRNWGEHTLIWGVNYQQVDYDSEKWNEPVRAILPEAGDGANYGLFLHNETRLWNDAVAISYGARLEENERGGSAFQPNIRASWRIDEHVVLWGSIARAVRTPSIAEEDLTARNLATPEDTLPPMPVPVVRTVMGAGDLDAEVLDAFDLGLRWHASESLSFDVAAFLYDYEELILAQFVDLRCVSGDSVFLNPACVATSPTLTSLIEIANAGDADSTGFEVVVSWDFSDALSMRLSHTYLDLDIEGRSPVGEYYADLFEGPNPDHSTAFKWRYSPHANWQIDGQLRYVDDIAHPDIDSYLLGDLRVSWMPKPGLSLALVGQDIGDSRHLEFVDNLDSRARTEVESAVFVQLHLSF